MKASTRNTTRGTVNIVKGDTKIAVGKLTRDRLLEAKGHAQELVGKIQKAVGTKQKSEGN
jgi:uncharacterized protein YjbJ (UPF0337 family)